MPVEDQKDLREPNSKIKCRIMIDGEQVTVCARVLEEFAPENSVYAMVVSPKKHQGIRFNVDNVHVSEDGG